MKIKKYPEIDILPADTKFTNISARDSGFLCSRCGKLISENEITFRVWPKGRKYEWRYHVQCIFPGSKPGMDIGVEISLDPEKDL